MQEYKIDIVLPDGNIEKANVEENTKIEELAKKYNPFFKNQVILSIYNGKLRELCKKIDRDGKIEFLTIADRDGRRTYRRSVILLLQRAVQKLYGDEVELKVLHSLGEGYYCEIINLNKSVLKLHEDDISSIKKTMDQLVQQNIPITKSSEKTQAAEEMFAGLGMKDKERLLHYRRSSRVNIYELDGINVDFENIYEADKDKYSRFIIELVPRMKEIGIVTSVDVTAPDGAPNWSMCYDRNIIGDVADYLIFMGYDQYGQSSTKPGTTAGYNWVETSLKKIIDYDQVPTDKIILGMPLYTRQWTVNQDGGIVSRDVVSMMNVKIPNNVEKQWDDELNQYYIEYKSGKNTVKMWIEDGTSISAKVSLVTKYQLGGTSCWRKDMETSNIWTIINSELTK